MYCDLRVKCDGCMWIGTCPGDCACDDYTPWDEMDDVEIQILIESRRDEYRRAWAEYVSQY